MEYGKKRDGTCAACDTWPPPWLAPVLPAASAAPEASPDPLTWFLADPQSTPQPDLDRLIAGAHRLDDATLESFNAALARRYGLDPDDLRETARAFDRPTEPPIAL